MCHILGYSGKKRGEGEGGGCKVDSVVVQSLYPHMINPDPRSGSIRSAMFATDREL